MFLIKKIDHKNDLLTHFHVYNEKTSFKIFPNLGASLQELSVCNIPIIHGIAISDKGILDYQSSFKSSLLFPFPGRIEKGHYTHNQQSHQLVTNDSKDLNAIHGLVYNQHFKLDVKETYVDHAKIVLSYVSDGKLKGFPFEFQLSITYLMTEDSLQLSFNIKNLGQDSFPFGMGWHPYFDLLQLHSIQATPHRYFKSDKLSSNSLTFSSEKQLVCDENQIPKTSRDHILKTTFDIEDKYFDDTFNLSNNIVIFNTEKYVLEMKLGETAETFLQLFTPSEKNSIAIEPMTCSPDAFNNEDGLKVLQPGATFHWQIDLNFKMNV